ncbi:MAG: alkaline phosphatase family protein [Terriglobales bacterium]|jgi:phospholipase C
MRLIASSLSLLLLSTSLTAQLKNSQLKPTGFPSQITHVVVIFQENRTPDNLFHFITPACPIPIGAKGLQACTPSPVTTSCYDVSPCGLSNKSGTVKAVTLTGVPLFGSSDPSHAHTAFEQMCDPDPANGYACRNDGAWQIKQGGGVSGNSYGYVQNPAVTNYDGSSGHLLDPYLTYATQYGWANFMYQTNQGPSYPAHQFLFSGTSARSFTEDMNSTFISENYQPKGTAVGCLAPANATTTLLSPLLSGGTLCSGGNAFDSNSVQECQLTNTALVFPTNPVGSFCDTKNNMGAVLDGINVSWKYYAPSAGSIWTAPNSIADICVPKFKSKKNSTLECSGSEWTQKVDLTLKGADVLNDITNCNLPSVSWVIPDGSWSDHAGPNDQYGPSWVTAVINAIGTNPTCTSGSDVGQTFWNNTAIIITWDDWGGWSDNQPALTQPGLPCTSYNCQADYQIGFRVPLVVVSAYTPVGYIDNDNYDFGSILRTIEGIYGVTEGTMGVADARSTTDLSNFFGGSFRPYMTVPAVEPASFFLGQAVQKRAPVPPDNDGDDD